MFKIKLANMSFAQKKAFTLVEVLVSAVILAVGLVIIFQIFLSSLDIVDLFENRLDAQAFINEKIWQLQSTLDQKSGIFIPSRQAGAIILGNREFNWQLDMESVDSVQETYKVSGQMSWYEGKKQRNIKRQTMVMSSFSNANPWKVQNK